MTRSWTSILWAVQSKLKQEDSTVHLIKAFQKFGLNWAAFPLVPFADSCYRKQPLPAGVKLTPEFVRNLLTF